MREIRPSGSVEGVMGNPDPYSDFLAPRPLLFYNYFIISNRQSQAHHLNFL